MPVLEAENAVVTPMTPEQEELARAQIALRERGAYTGSGGTTGNPPEGTMGAGSGVEPSALSAPSGLAATEAQALAEAKARLGNANVTGQTPAQAAAAAQAALAAAQAGQLGGPRVVGMTKGGFQPSTRQSSAQVERVQMPPGYLDVASEELRQDQAAGAGSIELQLLAEAQARKSAKVRRTMEDIQRYAEENAAAEEDAALKGAQEKIDSAIAQFNAAKPTEITYADIWRGADTGGKVTLALGFIAGTLGSMGGGPNQFLEQLDHSIQRKIDIQQEESERAEKAIGQERTAYDVIHGRFRDADVTRKTLNLMYLRQFDQYVAEKAAELGMGSGNPRMHALRSAILNKQRGIMKELGSKILEQQANADKYVPPQAISVGGGTAAGKEKPNEYELARLKEGLPKKQAAAKKLKELVSSMDENDRGFFENLARRKAAVDPGSWYEFFLRSNSPGKTQAMLQAVNTIVQDSGGKALTKDEASRYAAHIVGDGSPEALIRGSEFAQQLVSADEEALHSAFPRQYQEGNLRRGIYRNVDQPHELEGLEKQPDFNKRVISP